MDKNLDNPFDPQIESTSPLRLALIFAGVICAILFSFQVLARYIGDSDPNSTASWIFGILTYVLLLATLLYLVVTHRDKNCGGQLTYNKAFGTAMLCVLFYSLFMSLATYLWFTIDPDLITQMKLRSQEALEQNTANLSDEQVEKQSEMMSKFQTPLWISIFSIFGNLIFGCILALIAAAFNRSFSKKAI